MGKGYPERWPLRLQAQRKAIVLLVQGSQENVTGLRAGRAGALLRLHLKLTSWLQVLFGSGAGSGSTAAVPPLPGSESHLASSFPLPWPWAGITLRTGTSHPAGGQLHRHREPLGISYVSVKTTTVFSKEIIPG